MISFILPRQNGFTLFELMVVVIIVGILASFAIPQLGDAIEKSKIAEAIPLVDVYAYQAKDFYSQNGVWPAAADIVNLDVTVPVPKYFTALQIAGCGTFDNNACTYAFRSTGANTNLYIARYYNGPRDGQLVCNQGGDGAGFCQKMGADLVTGVLPSH